MKKKKKSTEEYLAMLNDVFCKQHYEIGDRGPVDML